MLCFCIIAGNSTFAAPSKNRDLPQPEVQQKQQLCQYYCQYYSRVLRSCSRFRRWVHKHKSTSILSLFLDAYVWDVNYTRLSRLGRSFEISFAICQDFGSLCTATMCTEHTHLEDFSPPSVATNATGGHHLA